MWSNIVDYQAFLEKEFLSFLSRSQASEKTIRNYVSDIKNFFSYLTLVLPKIRSSEPALPSDVLTYVTPTVIENYKAKELRAGTPESTINRRLSAIRMFFKMAMKKNWLRTNPAETVPNVGKNRDEGTLTGRLYEFKIALLSSGRSSVQTDEVVNEVKNFLKWLENKT